MSNVIDNKEMQAAKQEAKTSSATYTHKFATPFEFEGKTYENLTFNWGALTGYDHLAIEAEIAAMGKALVTPEFSGEFLVRMASRACTEEGVGSDALMAMPFDDFHHIRGKARSFLLKTAL